MNRDKGLELLRRHFPAGRVGLPFTPLDYIHSEGAPLEALLYAYLFWPEFINVLNMVFLQDSVEDASDLQRIRETLEKKKGDKRRTQESFNTFQVAELFGTRTGDTTPEEDGLLAQVLAEMWRARLRSTFPESSTRVRIDPPDETSGVSICFYLE